ncbi:MAG: NUDIX hydrolase [Bacteroidetes bacterium]|nr:NUDIX hydrolase [Bacteroidota bacterium]
MSQDLNWKTRSSTYLFREDWFKIRKDVCERQDGKIVDPYYVYEFPDWVTALPLTEEGKIILIRQYRHALGEVCIELPGGCVDKADPSMEDAIRREMLEETGFAFEQVHLLGQISSNPSTNNNLMHMFIATGGRKIQKPELDSNEEIEVFEVSFDELEELVKEKRIVQSMHLSTIFYALYYLKKIDFVKSISY